MFKYLKYIYSDGSFKDYIVFREDDATFNIVIRESIKTKKTLVMVEIWDNCKGNHDTPDYSLLTFNNVKRIYISDNQVYHIIEERNVIDNVLKCCIKWPGYHKYPELKASWYE